MSRVPGVALIDISGNTLVDAAGHMIVTQVSVGTYYFLYDHFVDEEYIQAGETREMFVPWTPTADVEPLDATAVQAFWEAGPSLGAVVRTRLQQYPVRRPVTYWYKTTGFYWALSGLGAGLAPRSAPRLGRIEDK